MSLTQYVEIHIILLVCNTKLNYKGFPMKNTILHFLQDLATTQAQVIVVLQEKQSLLVCPDKKKLEEITPKENEVLNLLHQIQLQREQILQEAANQGAPSVSIQEVCHALFPTDLQVQRLLETTTQGSQQIRYLALANLTMTQRSIIHLAQVLEIIETRGQGKVTYHTGVHTQENKTSTGGGFVDRVA